MGASRYDDGPHRTDPGRGQDDIRMMVRVIDMLMNREIEPNKRQQPNKSIILFFWMSGPRTR